MLDGTRVIVKWIRPGDLVSRLTGGIDRLGHVWESGVLEHLPPGIDHAMIGVERVADGWLVVQRDVTPWLVDLDQGIDAAQRVQLAGALARLHNALRGATEIDPARLGSTADYFSQLTPAALAGTPDDESDGLVGAVRQGWDALPEVFPADVAEAVVAVAAEPRSLAAEIERRQPLTLVHGDVFWGNLAFAPDRLVLLDWSQLLGWGPPIVDVTMFLSFSGHLVAGGNDAVLADYVTANAEAGVVIDEGSVDLALLGALTSSGWNKALVAAHAETAEERERELIALEWWFAAARRALQRWSP